MSSIIIISIIVIVLITILITWYNYSIIKALFRKPKRIGLILILLNGHLLLMFIIFGALVATGYIQGKLFTLAKYLLSDTMLTVLPQILFSIILLGYDIIRGGIAIITLKRPIKRHHLLIKSSLLLSAILFGYLVYGLSAPLNIFETVRIDLRKDGKERLKIVQISDLHLGNLSKKDYKGLQKMVKLCNAENPDILVITGDVINNYPDEIVPYRDILNSLSAKKGKYFIWGNHDIGKYNQNESKEEKRANILTLQTEMQNLGYTVISDSITKVATDTDTIYFMGVNEYAKNDYTKRYTALYRSIPKGNTIISLSHDPAFFDIMSYANPLPEVELTLAGHTHAMQIVMYIPFFGDWSPSQLLHKYSHGIYEHGDMKLYVNRGIGHHIYRRLGAHPEITVFNI